jgi:hypothetical protein
MSLRSIWLFGFLVLVLALGAGFFSTANAKPVIHNIRIEAHDAYNTPMSRQSLRACQLEPGKAYWICVTEDCQWTILT